MTMTQPLLALLLVVTTLRSDCVGVLESLLCAASPPATLSVMGHCRLCLYFNDGLCHKARSIWVHCGWLCSFGSYHGVSLRTHLQLTMSFGSLPHDRLTNSLSKHPVLVQPAQQTFSTCPSQTLYPYTWSLAGTQALLCSATKYRSLLALLNDTQSSIRPNHLYNDRVCLPPHLQTLALASCVRHLRVTLTCSRSSCVASNYACLSSSVPDNGLLYVLGTANHRLTHRSCLAQRCPHGISQPIRSVRWSSVTNHASFVSLVVWSIHLYGASVGPCLSFGSTGTWSKWSTRVFNCLGYLTEGSANSVRQRFWAMAMVRNLAP
eukprot:Gb_33247 [translate_table: standard]